MAPFADRIAAGGIVLANLLFLSVRLYASRHGLSVRWLTPSLFAERRHLRGMAKGPEEALAEGARFYLRVEVLAWTIFVVTAAAFVILKVAW
jgi:hypothetical protein